MCIGECLIKMILDEIDLGKIEFEVKWFMLEYGCFSKLNFDTRFKFLNFKGKGHFVSPLVKPRFGSKINFPLIVIEYKFVRKSHLNEEISVLTLSGVNPSTHFCNFFIC